MFFIYLGYKSFFQMYFVTISFHLVTANHVCTFTVTVLVCRAKKGLQIQVNLDLTKINI